MKRRPKITVVVTAHGISERLVSHAVGSLARQTLPRDQFEIVVVHEAGRTNTFAPVPSRGTRGFHEGFVKRVELPPEATVGAARNAGAAEATADLVLFLDGDDLLVASCLLAFARAAEQYPSATVLFANSVKYAPDMRSQLRAICSTAYYELYRDYRTSPYNPIFHSIFVGHPLAAARRYLLDGGAFDEHLPCAELTEFAVRAHATGQEIRHIPQYLYRYRESPNGLSKHPQLHERRISAITHQLNSLHGMHADAKKVETLGRIAPYQHFHYQIYDWGTRMTLPYIDYPSGTLKSPGVPCPRRF
ncbi:glycosyltransferase [Streptomyces sp. NPDC055287]